MNCKCMAHFVPDEDEEHTEGQEVYSDEESKNKRAKTFTTLYVIKFDKDVTARDKKADE